MESVKPSTPMTPRERVEAFARELEALSQRYGCRVEAFLEQPAPQVVVAKLRVVPTAEG